jgi:hypothetical protein
LSIFYFEILIAPSKLLDNLPGQFSLSRHLFFALGSSNSEEASRISKWKKQTRPLFTIISNSKMLVSKSEILVSFFRSSRWCAGVLNPFSHKKRYILSISKTLPPRPWTISWRIVRSIVQKEFVDKFTKAVVPPKKFNYCKSAIISRSLYIFYYTAVFIVERLILQTINVLYKEILQFLALKSTVYNQERFQIKRGL